MIAEKRKLFFFGLLHGVKPSGSGAGGAPPQEQSCARLSAET